MFDFERSFRSQAESEELVRAEPFCFSKIGEEESIMIVILEYSRYV